FAVSTWQMSHYTLATSPSGVVWALLVQGLGFSFLFVPLTTVALASVPRQRMADATGLNSLMRQLGGSIGLATFATLMTRYQAQTPPPAATEPTRSKRRPFVLVAIVAGVLLTGIAGYMIWTHGEENTDDAQVSADLVPIGTRVAGQVVKVHVQENQNVKKGDLLIEIDAADYTARVKQAEA